MKRILIVEDEPSIALALEDDLRREGYQTELAIDGDTAARRALSREFDLILLDVMLPGQDGFEVCRQVRRAGVETPIVLLTARAQEAEKVMGLEAGADDYVTKPYSARELRARIKAHLRRSAGQAQRFIASATRSWTSAAASCGAAERWWTSQHSSSSCFRPSSSAPAACFRAPSCSTRCGDPVPMSPTGWWTTR